MYKRKYIDINFIAYALTLSHQRKTYREAGEKIFITKALNRSITDRNQLNEGEIGASHGKTRLFKTRVRKMKISEGK